MPYITIMQTPRTHQITLEEILKGEIDVNTNAFGTQDVSGTVTKFYEKINDEIVRRANIPSMIKVLSEFVRKYSALYDSKRESLYNTFPIPKNPADSVG